MYQKEGGGVRPSLLGCKAWGLLSRLLLETRRLISTCHSRFHQVPTVKRCAEICEDSRALEMPRGTRSCYWEMRFPGQKSLGNRNKGRSFPVLRVRHWQHWKSRYFGLQANRLFSVKFNPRFSFNLHNDGHMIIHVLIDVAQKAGCNNTHPAKRNADQVHPPVALRIRNLPGSDDNLPRGVIARDTRY